MTTLIGFSGYTYLVAVWTSGTPNLKGALIKIMVQKSQIWFRGIVATNMLDSKYPVRIHTNIFKQGSGTKL